MSLEPKKVHFIGIAGKGMSGLAVMLKNMGWDVSGSDAGAFGAPAEYLVAADISFATVYSSSNIPADADLIIIGKHAKLTKDNTEVAAAFESGVSIKSFAEVLGDITTDRTNIVVVGSYAKSTCTSLLAWCLMKNDLDPGYFIGASPLGFEKTADYGTAPYFILEGDEYPASNFDPASKFSYLHPEYVLLTSGEQDHVNVFPTIESYLKPYKELLRSIPKKGSVVGCIDNPHVKDLLQNTDAKVVTYSFSDQTSWHARHIQHSGKKVLFELWNKDEKIIDMETVLIGDYNIQNIIGVAALLIENKILSKENVASAVQSFEGVSGRLDLKNPAGRISVYESYGSSYAKAKSSIQALIEQFPKKKLHIVFEPHTFTWRDPSQRNAYKDVFSGSTSVILFPTPSSHGKNAAGQLSLQEISELIPTPSHIAENADDALTVLEKELTPDSVVLIITSGEAGGLTKTVPELIERV